MPIQWMNQASKILPERFSIHMMYWLSAPRPSMLDSKEISLLIDEFFKVFTVKTITQQTIQNALSLRDKYHYSYFDCLMLSSALLSDCSILYSEDMHHSHTLENTLKIIDPFHG
jgi:predicted nucleic acid-binding protein